tara:strand:+ start:117 stop:911 length:795 start_codon:yes stop_codon:yes gene_type:complete
MFNKRNYIENNLVIEIPKIKGESKIKDVFELIAYRFSRYLPIYNSKRKQERRRIDDLKIINYETIIDKKNNLYYVIFFTQIYENHPILVQMRVKGKSFTIHFFKPVGDKEGHISITEFRSIVSYLKPQELIGFRIALKRSYAIRKYKTIFDPRYKIVKCEKIRRCRAVVRKIQKERISYESKVRKIAIKQEEYIAKAIKALTKYFMLIETNDLWEARAFLEGKKAYKNKVRIETMFLSGKKVLGHLKFFIALKELLNDIDMYLE